MTEAVAITITIDGKAHTFRPSEVTAQMSGEVRRATGMALRSYMAAATDDPDLDVLAVLAWVARLQAGETVTYDEVASSITYGSKIDTDGVADPEDADSPEA